MTNWKEYKLGEIGEVITGNTPSKKNPEQWGDNMPFVTPTDFDAYNKNISDSIRYLSKEGISAFRQKVLPVNSVIVTCIGSQMGKVALNKKECVTNQQINSIIPNKAFNSDFIYYVISSMQDYLRNLATGGSTMPIVNKSTFEDITIKAPDIDTQTAIAEILSSLDDKIELNNKINQELENLAQTLFKQWFIDFEFPNENGEPYKSSGGEMVECPDSYREGEIPKGWEVGTLNDILEVKGGTTPSTKEPSFWDGEFHWTSPRDLSNLQFPLLLNTDKKVTKEGLKKISSGLLPKGTLLLSSRAPIGYLAITEIETAINQGYIAINAREGFSNLYLLYWIKSNMDLIIKRANGSTFLEISKTNFKQINCLIPSKKILNEYVYQIEVLFEQLRINLIENQELTNLRDTLLPKLISGELEVADIMAEKA